jgi:prepilin-type N-terminal cleavage/methylation domain-containing protein
MCKDKKGFTLVELLVVISIIAILLAILMPSLNKAKEQAKMLICATHQRSILTAVTCYTSEYQGKLTPSTQGYATSATDSRVGHWAFPIRLKYYYKNAKQLNGGSVIDLLGGYMKDPINWNCPLGNNSVDWQKKYFKELKDQAVGMMDCSYMMYWNYLGYYKEKTGVSGIYPFGFNPVMGKDTLMISDLFLPTDSFNTVGARRYFDYMSAHPFKHSSLFPLLNITNLDDTVKVFMGDTDSKIPNVKINAGYLDGHIEKCVYGEGKSSVVKKDRYALPSKWR